MLKTCWVAYTWEEYDGDFGAKAVGLSKEGAVNGLRAYVEHCWKGVTVGNLYNDGVYDCVDVFVEEIPNSRNSAKITHFLLEFPVYE